MINTKKHCKYKFKINFQTTQHYSIQEQRNNSIILEIYFIITYIIIGSIK